MKKLETTSNKLEVRKIRCNSELEKKNIEVGPDPLLLLLFA